tara:strand:+ start:304 stop:579 length:276 start_codon:yes stop_codon:yes gene_type:complete
MSTIFVSNYSSDLDLAFLDLAALEAGLETFFLALGADSSSTGAGAGAAATGAGAGAAATGAGAGAFAAALLFACCALRNRFCLGLAILFSS